MKIMSLPLHETFHQLEGMVLPEQTYLENVQLKPTYLYYLVDDSRHRPPTPVRVTKSEEGLTVAVERPDKRGDLYIDHDYRDYVEQNVSNKNVIEVSLQRFEHVLNNYRQTYLATVAPSSDVIAISPAPSQLQ